MTLYRILDRIEWFTITPWFFAVIPSTALGFSMVGMSTKGYFAGDAWGVGMIVGVVIVQVAGTLLLKRFVFNPRRAAVVARMQALLTSDPSYIAVMESMEQVDPDMMRNIRRCIPRAA